MSLNQGASAEIEYIIAESDLANALNPQIPGLDFPAVYTTGRMISLMEQAAAKLLLPLLGAGELSVGVNVNITHLAPTLPSEQVRAVATYQGLDGKLHLFEVEVFDGAGQIGKGTHTRAIVSADRIIAGASKRKTAS